MAGRGPEGLEGLEKFLLALLSQAGPGFTQRLGCKHRLLQIWKFRERFYAECGRLVAAVFWKILVPVLAVAEEGGRLRGGLPPSDTKASWGLWREAGRMDANRHQASPRGRCPTLAS